MMAPSKENWLKGVQGLRKVTYALILFLEDYFTQVCLKWSNGDNHLEHLLDLGAKGELKQTKKEGQYWDVNCTDCKPILEELVNCHRQPNRLMWNNNEEQTVTASDAYKLSKLFMSNGNADSLNLRDRDPLAVLEVYRNEKRIGFTDTAFVLILFRNRLMHSCDNCITEEELTGAFDEMKALLGNDKLKTREECKTAVTELNELLQKPMLCEIDESIENWKMATSIKEMAMRNEGMISPEVSPEVNPEALKKLLEDTQSLLLAEKNQRQNAESSLANSERDLQESKSKEQYEKRRAEQAKSELENQGSQKQNLQQAYESLQEDNRKLQKAYENLQKENRKLQEEMNEFKAKAPSLSNRIIGGTSTGATVGIAGGVPGVIIGGTAGGVVAGATYIWDKFGWK